MEEWDWGQGSSISEHTTKKQEEKHDSYRSQKSPSPQIEEEEQSEQGGGDLESTPFRVKWNREQEKEGPWKKTKAINLSLDSITLTEGDVEFLTVDQQIMQYTKAKYQIYFYNKLCGSSIEYEKDQIEHI